MQITNATIQSFYQQIDFRYQAGYQRRKTYYGDIAEVIPSSTRQNVYTWLAELPGLRKWIGPKLARNIAARTYSLINDDYEDTMEISRNDLEDDLAGIYGRKAELMGDAAARWPDDLVVAQLIAATTTVCYDGQPFFNGSHPVDIDDTSQGTFSNLLTSRTLNQANFNFAYKTMQQYKGESGKPLEVTPTMLIAGPDNRQAALEICKAGLIAQIAKNVAASENVAASAPTNVNQGEVTPLILPRLIDDTAGAWYLVSTDRVKPLIFQQREAPRQVMMTDPQNPVVFRERKLTWGVEARGAAGVSLPFLMLRCTP